MTHRLRSELVVEPLVHQWYAWSHVLAPAPAARHVVERHVKLMRSYLRAPEIHEAAIRQGLGAGPFMDLPRDARAGVEALLAATLDRQAPLVELGAAIGELERLLAEADGHSLEPLYARVPAPLRGLVELHYDHHHHASARYLEPLLYRSRYYDPRLQSMRLSLAGEHRRFVLSTPLLRDPRVLQLDLPFRDPALDALFRAERTPVRVDALAEQLRLAAEQRALLAPLVTTEPAALAPRFAGPGMRVRYFGHACLLVETRELTLLTDPLFAATPGHDPPRFTIADLPERIDYVVITHHHKDHFLLESLLRLRHRVGCFVVPRAGGALEDPSLALLLRELGFSAVRELGELEELELPGGALTGVPFLGEHADLDVRGKLAYHLRVGGRAFLVAADSRNVEPALYRNLRAALGDVDVIFVGMECDGAPLSWLYGPMLPEPLERGRDQSRRLSGSDFERALAMVDALRCREVYVYAMGLEPWIGFLTATEYGPASPPLVASDRLIAELTRRGGAAERLYGARELHYEDRS